MKLLPEGAKAPLFTLSNQNEEQVKLTNLLKSNDYVVVYFYPKALTPGCTVQACAITENLAKFKKNKISVVGISCDPAKKLKKFEEKHQLTFDLLSDEDHQVCEEYGVWGEKKMMGRTYMGINRVSYILNKKGKIIHVMKKVDTKTHHQDILNFIKDYSE
jgi:peroxiredoxin Q/BCP